MAHLYFTEAPLDASTTVAELTGEEAHHAAQVARLRVGESVSISDGRGWRAQGVATAVAKSRVDIALSNPEFDPEPSLAVTLVQALAKGGRDEMAVQTCTELGVNRVIPWQAERSISRWEGDKRTKGVVRWQSIAREASKQAMRSRIPAVTDPMATAGLLAAAQGSEVLVLDPRSSIGIGEWARAHPTATSVAVVVGPEGGITASEVDVLVSAGATAVRVGDDIMRTSTAGPAAIAALRALLGQW